MHSAAATREPCEFTAGGMTVSVSHGEIYVDPGRCVRCLCQNGDGTFCEPAGDCTSLSRTANCVREDDGVEIAHGETFQVKVTFN